MWFDTHAHPTAENLSEEAQAMQEARVTGVVVVGTDPVTSAEAPLLARTLADRFTARATIGIHPHDAEKSGVGAVEALAELIARYPREVVGVGECGLDYFYEYSPREAQREVFSSQVRLARAHDKTLVIHARDAFSDLYQILEDEPLPSRVIMHCFVGGADDARRCLELGCYISFSGIVTFKNAQEVRDAALVVPDDRILVETDAPYLAPVPLRGKPNRIANVAITGEFVAKLRGQDVGDFASRTSKNALQAFAIAPAQR